MKRLLGALTVLVSVAAVTPAGAAEAPSREVIARYTFDGLHDGVVTLHGSVDIAPGAVFSDVAVDETVPGHPAAFFPEVIDLAQSDGLRGYGDGNGLSLCSVPLSCTVSGGKFRFSATYSISNDGKRPVHLRYYIAVRGPHATITDGVLLHWTSKHSSTGLVTRTDSDAAGGGIDAFGDDAGVMTGVSAPGPRRGSVAILVPGCDGTGAGAASLSGGVVQPTVVCPSDAVADVAMRTTTWSASGAVAGVSANQTRLLVLPR